MASIAVAAAAAATKVLSTFSGTWHSAARTRTQNNEDLAGKSLFCVLAVSAAFLTHLHVAVVRGKQPN